MWAVITLVGDGEEVTLGRIRTDRPDLALIDVLARLQLAAKRCGYAIRLTRTSGELCELLDLTGLRDVVGAEPLLGDPGR
jgi:hypothetical protein